jgi:hypothetical protein
MLTKVHAHERVSGLNERYNCPGVPIRGQEIPIGDRNTIHTLLPHRKETHTQETDTHTGSRKMN